MTHKKDLIEDTCKGAGKRFAEVVCEFFLNDDNRNCRLLKEEPFEKIFENGRCEPLNMLEQSITYHLDDYRDRLDQSLLAKKIFHKRILLGLLEEPGNSLKNQKLKKGSFNLFTLRRYLNTSVQREVSTLLREEGIFPDFECGNCVFLSPQKPYVCQHNEAYGGTVSYYNEKRRPSDRACDNFNDNTSQLGDNKISSNDSEEDTEIQQIENFLLERTIQCKDAKTRDQLRRQYDIFCRLRQEFEDGNTIADVVKAVAEELGIATKTIKRDIEAMQVALKKMSRFN